MIIVDHLLKHFVASITVSVLHVCALPKRLRHCTSTKCFGPGSIRERASKASSCPRAENITYRHSDQSVLNVF